VPTFAFTARSAAGRPGRAVTGLRVADSEGALAPALAAEGLFLIRAEPARPKPRTRGWTRGWSWGRFTPRDRSLLLLHLATYLEAGIPILETLQDFRQPDRPRLEAAAVAMAEGMAEGAALSELMARQDGLFEPVHVAMVRAGEATGRLDEALRAVLKHADWNGRLRAQVRRAAWYPLVLITVLALVALLACTYSLPPIMAMLEGLGVPLPAETRVLLATVGGLNRHGWLLALVPLPILGLVAALRDPGRRLAWDTAFLHLPVAGRLIAQVALARFALSLAAQYRAGLPLVQALRNSEGVTGNARIGDSIRRLRHGVEQGGGLAATAAKVGYVPQLLIRMLAVGETTGNLEETLDKAAEHCEADVEEGVRLCFQVLDPVLKVVMAGLLLFVAAAVLLPLYLMIGNING